jgi:hypothetical protein
VAPERHSIGASPTRVPARKVVPVPVLQLLVLAVLSMVGLAALRLIRVHLGRTPLPDGPGRRLFLLGFVIVPPLLLGVLIQPATAAGPARGIAFLPIYVGALAVLVILMAIAAFVIGSLVHSRTGRLARLALVGVEADPARDIPTDPPITAQLAKAVGICDRANAAFPRGAAFPAQVDRAGFRADWETLDVATGSLERSIASERLLAIGVAATAEATARDARNRLDSLRRIAAQSGQAWATDPNAIAG